MLNEAFAYEWHDTLNNKRYFGKHKGSITDNYAHSSSVMPAFKMNTKPDHMHRTILATGTAEEISLLEHTVLKTLRADPELWAQYYNIGLGDPNYVPMDGDNNNNYKTGKYTNRLNDPELYTELDKIDHVIKWPTKSVYDKRRQMFRHHAKMKNRIEAELEWNLWYEYHPKRGKQAKAIQAGDTFELWYNHYQDHLHIEGAVMTKEYRKEYLK